MSKLEDALLINSSAYGACLLLPVQAMQRQIRITWGCWAFGQSVCIPRGGNAGHEGQG